ncbi:hypothetical protein ACFDR9_002651 [Janthinobacterium sp. CG_23.3]|uniref:DUF262 domain-containing protein n=1 Tax=Janthinobacterium sp. CG_23.3 TaxID=3349634 RepID=UPI0038D4F1A0
MDEHKFFKISALEAKTLAWWRARKDRIDFDPTYQRKGRRWSTSDKQYLIDSILNGFDIPKFYVADFTWGQSKLNEQKKAYAVIDGKQRFEAIFEFFNDDFSLSHTFSLLSMPSLKLGGKKYSQLKTAFPDIAEVFENFNPSVVGVLTDDISFVEELFVRLNRSKPLSGAEIRNAVSTPVSQMVRTIGNHDFFKSYVKFATGKGQNLNCAAKLLMFEALGLQETKKSTLDRFSSAANNEHQRVEKALPIVLETLGNFSELFQFRDPLLNSEGPIPIYYWLARNAAEKEAPFVRDFIEYFQGLIKIQPTPKSKGISLADWNNYKVASRSINDKSSHELRYSILRKYFEIWLSKNV